MEDIMGYSLIYVTHKSRRSYKRIFMDDDLPTYIPTDYKQGEDIISDQILFLPIESKIFDTDRKNFHVGFVYTFTTVNQSTVSLLKDPNILGVTNLQISARVNRFRYRITGERDILIDKICDPLYPPRIIDLQCPTKKVSETSLQIVTDIINQLNKWYVDKNV